QFRDEPRRIWRRGEGGAALYGGLILSVATSVPVLAFADLPFCAFWDTASVAMLIALIIGRFGCLVNGCCVGRATTNRFGVWLPDHRGEWRRRFPTPLLEMGWATLVLAGTFAVRIGLRLNPGALFAGVLAAYAAGRFVLERTREIDGALRASTANLAFSVML